MLYVMWVCEKHYRDLGRLLGYKPVELTFFHVSEITPCKCGKDSAHRTRVSASRMIELFGE
jgi:hypothetical protein